jgi:hypothetical protein
MCACIICSHNQLLIKHCYRVVLQFDHVMTVHFLVSHPGHMLLANHFMFLYISIASVDLVNASHLPFTTPALTGAAVHVHGTNFSVAGCKISTLCLVVL